VSSAAEDAVWGADDQMLVRLIRNVATRYIAIVVDGLIGLMVLPFNVRHLGASAYGLWMLAGSISVYFSVLDLGFGGSITKFVAVYRARRDARSLNEIVSTLFVIFVVIGALTYSAVIGVSLNIEHVLNLTPEQVVTARRLLLVIGVYVAASFPASVFGGIINGFQRYDVNSVVGIASSIAVAVTNVSLLTAGYSLVQVVCVTTAIRLLTYVVYTWNAYSIFPSLAIRLSYFRWSRVRELTSFSVYISVINWSAKLNYSTDAIVIGAFMSSAAVAVWTVPQRIAELLQRLTSQLNAVLFPVVVDSDAGGKPDRLRAIFLQGTSLSMVAIAPVAAVTMILAGPLVRTWVGDGFADGVPVLQLLTLVVAVRVGSASAATVLKGTGRHPLLAATQISMALTNLALSLLWIRRFGLVGQAMGTLVPIAAGSLFVLWPAACRRVGIDVIAAFRQSVWPALWPVVTPIVLLLPLRDVLPHRLSAVAGAAGVGVVAYLITFLALAVKTEQRRRYASRIAELARARWSLAKAA
jgi:O-antigen/teichoic acid export membrane protein